MTILAKFVLVLVFFMAPTLGHDDQFNIPDSTDVELVVVNLQPAHIVPMPSLHLQLTGLARPCATPRSMLMPAAARQLRAAETPLFLFHEDSTPRPGRSHGVADQYAYYIDEGLAAGMSSSGETRPVRLHEAATSHLSRRYERLASDIVSDESQVYSLRLACFRKGA